MKKYVVRINDLDFETNDLEQAIWYAREKSYKNYYLYPILLMRREKKEILIEVYNQGTPI